LQVLINSEDFSQYHVSELSAFYCGIKKEKTQANLWLLTIASSSRYIIQEISNQEMAMEVGGNK
jgi:hypothetical protein